MNLSETNNIGRRSEETFLGSVASAYLDNFDDLSEFCFVFPNKRAGTFFRKSLAGHLRGRTLLAPEIMSVTDFTAVVARREPAGRLDLIFRLYRLYRELAGASFSLSDEISLLDFDAFRGWGDTLISDFNEVDRYCVDADMLFRNVKDFREIAANFLTEEQVAVMERYFGYSPSHADVEGFWKELVPPDETSVVKSHFIYLWQMMSPLYHALNESLERDGFCTPGGASRIALENVVNEGRSALRWKKVVFVGFNALSTSEALLFGELRDLDAEPDIAGDYAEFFWDGTGPVLSGKGNDAVRYLNMNRKNFPSPGWAEKWLLKNKVEDITPNMRVIAAPSNTIQAKMSGDIVGEIVDALGSDMVRDARVAIVLPDENLLMPLLYSLPESVADLNLTMGYPLRLTSVASFMYHFRKLQTRHRTVRNEAGYYHEDLRLFLAHPFSHALLGSDTVSRINGDMNLRHTLILTESRLAELSPEAAFFLRRLPAEAGSEEAADYIDEVLVSVDAALAGTDKGGVVKSRIDRSHIALYREALCRLRRSAADQGIEMSPDGMFYMIDRLLAGEQATFEGEPLEGLQVMGILETRALDFDYVIIPSLNDRVMPRKARARTFIPDSLRHGYGLPYSNHQENLYSYYFYRLLSRAGGAAMLYDARAGEGMRSGGMSRYLMQLRYLYAPGKIKFSGGRFRLSAGSSLPAPVEKSDAVMEKVMRFAEEGSKKNFSASALKKYCECQIRFYYEYVAGIKAENTPDIYMDAATQGTVLHDTILNLYFPSAERRRYLDARIKITPDYIDNILSSEKIDRELTRMINRHYFHRDDSQLDIPLQGAAELVGKQIKRQVKAVLSYDRQLAPFELAGGELKSDYRWRVSPELTVNMTYAIDRLDVVSENGSERWRIVDYKSGDPCVSASSFDAVFDGSRQAKNIFQLMLYAHLFNFDKGFDRDFRLSIYPVTTLLRDGEAVPRVAMPEDSGGEEEGNRVPVKERSVSLGAHKVLSEDFLERVNSMLSDIFDPTKPFLPPQSEEACRYCNLAELCGRR